MRVLYRSKLVLLSLDKVAKDPMQSGRQRSLVELALFGRTIDGFDIEQGKGVDILLEGERIHISAAPKVVEVLWD